MEPIYIRDPVHDYISVERPVIRDLLECPEVQRLRRIRQLGFSFVTYPGAEHSRFSHALGVMHLAELAVKQLAEHARGLGWSWSRLEKDAVVASALLHDVGHGPFSHVFERAFPHARTTQRKHEERTLEVVLQQTNINRILRKRSKDLPQLVHRFLTGVGQLEPKEMIARALLSSNFDLDRLDFVMRDSVFTGVRYGHVDAARLLHALCMDSQGRLAVRRKALAAVEELLYARYFMYWNVYYHKTTRCMEAVLLGWVNALWDAQDSLPDDISSMPLMRFIRGCETSSVFLSLDDSDVWSLAKRLATSEDPTLRDLSQRLLNRRPFKLITTELPDAHVQRKAMDWLDGETRYKSCYYYHQDKASDVAYNLLPYWEEKDGHQTDPVRILSKGDAAAQEVSRVSRVVAPLMDKITEDRVYAPEEVGADLKTRLNAT